MKYLILILLICSFIGCKTNRIKNNQRVGLWIVHDTINDDVYTYKGKYRKGNEIKTWRYFKNKQLYRKEIYRDSTSTITFFHKNGEVMQRGQSKLALDGTYLHWFYDGMWYEYDSLGKPSGTKFYDKGLLINSVK